MGTRDPMNLSVEDGRSFDSPNAEAIDAALCELDGERNSYSILSVSDSVYIQTAGSPAKGFVIEYRDGEGSGQMGTVHKDLPISRVVPVFQKYAAGDASWKVGLEWEVVDLRTKPANLKVFLAILAMIGLAVVFYFSRIAPK